MTKAWGNPVEVERRRRIRLSLWAYAYELQNVSLVSDHVFDEAAKLVDPSVSTGRPTLDQFFRTEFHPDTGMWIRQHPELLKVAALYRKVARP